MNVAPDAGASVVPAGEGAFEEESLRRHRDEWWFRQRAYPNHTIPEGAFDRAQAGWSALAARSRGGAPSWILPMPAANWTQVGPAAEDTTLPSGGWSPAAGRATALAIGGGAIYAGFAMGGVWKSVDDGLSWAPLTDVQPSLAIGAIAIDPANPSIIYAGTGEGTGSGDSWWGQGLLKSIDGGATWFRPAGTRFAGGSISKIWIDPASGAIYLGIVKGYQGNGDGCGNYGANPADLGFYKSSDGGKTWTRLISSATVDFDVDTNVMPRKFWVSFKTFGLYSYIEGGGLTHIAALPDQTSNPALSTRLYVTLAPSNHNVIYVGASLGTNPESGALYRSTDAGATWTKIPSAPDWCMTQCDYDHVVTVDPTNPDVVYLGGSLCSIWKTTNGTAMSPTFSAVSLPGGNCGANAANWSKGYVHPDAHAILIDPRNHLKVWTATDGGLAWSSDGGATWARANDGVATSQFYGVCVHPSDPEIMGGGMQDNGTAARRSATSIWYNTSTGDGGHCAFDDLDPDRFIHAVQYGTTYVSTNALAKKTLVFNASPGGCGNAAGCGDRASFIVPMVADPGNGQNLYIGTHRLWRSANAGATWTAISGDLTGGPGGEFCAASGGQADDELTAIAVAPSQGTTIYTGSAGGVVQASIAGAGFARVDKSPLPQRYVTGLAVDAAQPKTVYVAYSGFNAATPMEPGHVFRSDDGGVTWTSVDIGVDMPVNAIAADPVNRGVVYAGTDFGVLWSTDAGATWSVLGNGLPNVAVYDLAVSRPSGRLIAATHGRSAWAIAMYKPLGAACTDPTECGTGFCADGVCCNGACGGGLATDCQACSQAKGAAEDGRCGVVVNGTACNDGDACTKTDVCTAGVCGGTAFTCAAPDQCQQAGACNGDGTCSFANKTDGTACNDGDACTKTDVCTAGVCGGTAFTCAAPDQCHEAGTCNGDGTCSFANKTDGIVCNDGNACTKTDVCTAGVCGGVAFTCAAPDQCHQAGTCNGDGTCSFANKTDGTACNDGNACTKTDVCQVGACVGGNPVVCMARDACHAAGQCDPMSGMCSNPALPDGTACPGGMCASGICVMPDASMPPVDMAMPRPDLTAPIDLAMATPDLTAPIVDLAMAAPDLTAPAVDLAMAVPDLKAPAPDAAAPPSMSSCSCRIGASTPAGQALFVLAFGLLALRLGVRRRRP